MKKFFFIFISGLVIVYFGFGQEYAGDNASRIIDGSRFIRKYTSTSIPAYIEFDVQHYISISEFKSWMLKTFNLDSRYDFLLVNTTTDELGYIHYRYQEYFSGYPVDKAFYILHTQNGKIFSMNGLLFDNINIETNHALTEANALVNALQNINARVYKWQVPEEEQFLKNNLNDPNATYYPKGELVLINKNINSPALRIAYKFNIYAVEPLSRAFYYIDANTGEVLYKDPVIHLANSKGTAYTKYSGKRTIITDSFAASRFRLRETDRGNGIQTFNMLQGTTYTSAVDFIDSDNVWNQFNANWDEAATDAHWGSEMTYDFYKTTFNRNSLDNNGLLLKSYVHYGVNYYNAFWDGSEMTYGDGTNGKPFTLIDITGHEMTHGVVSYTAQLPGADEGGALNESFADIFGKSVEYFAKPLQTTWTMGDTIIPIRNLADPKSFGNPNTYKGQYWDSVTMEVHDNSTPQSYCFYLLCMGGSGTNDLGHTYTVTAIGRDKAERIFYRALTTYLTASSVYTDSRFYTIKAAQDLYGECSAEVNSVYEAWYAVGLGGSKRQTSFEAKQYFPDCFKNYTVNFINTSDTYNSYTWYFGDGKTSNAFNPSHVYANYGSYSVKLVAYDSCGKDSVTMKNFVVLDSNATCAYLMTKTHQTSTLCNGILFDDGGVLNYSPNFDGSFTISVTGSTAIVLKFKSFNFEDCGTTDCDFMEIYNGPTTASPLIGKYTGNNLPNGGIVKSTGSSITIQEHSDTLVDLSGFELEWFCSNPNNQPVADFTTDRLESCYGTISFTDLSINPVSWFWDFGDGYTSTLQNPVHTYTSNGTYSVKLIATNTHGKDTLLKNNLILIDMSSITSSPDTTICKNTIASLHAAGYDHIYWYNTSNPSALPVDSGNVFKTPLIASTKSYWVQGIPDIYSGNIGPVDNTFYTGGYFSASADHYEIFDAYTDFTIVSVKVYANGSGSRTFQLSDSTGKVLKDTIIILANGTSIVNLNFNVQKEKSLRLGVPGANNLYRNQGGASYPYQIAGVAKIIETDVALTSPGYYYFLYDWVLKIEPCKSIRKKITVSVDSLVKPNFSYSTSCYKATFQNLSQYGSSYLWLFGDGQSDISTAPVHTYKKNGSYTVKLIVTNLCNSDTIIKSVVISADLTPVANFSSTSAGLKATFQNMSSNGKTYYWDFGDGKSDTSKNPVHTYNSKGTYLIKLIVYNLCGSDTFTKSVNILGTSIDNTLQNSDISIYPNPATESIFVRITSSKRDNIRLRLINQLDQVIYEKDILNNIESLEEIQVYKLAKGIYFVQLSDDYGTMFRKIVVQ